MPATLSTLKRPALRSFLANFLANSRNRNKRRGKHGSSTVNDTSDDAAQRFNDLMEGGEDLSRPSMDSGARTLLEFDKQDQQRDPVRVMLEMLASETKDDMVAAGKSLTVLLDTGSGINVVYPWTIIQFREAGINLSIKPVPEPRRFSIKVANGVEEDITEFVTLWIRAPDVLDEAIRVLFFLMPTTSPSTDFDIILGRRFPHQIDLLSRIQSIQEALPAPPGSYVLVDNYERKEKQAHNATKVQESKRKDRAVRDAREKVYRDKERESKSHGGPSERRSYTPIHRKTDGSDSGGWNDQTRRNNAISRVDTYGSNASSSGHKSPSIFSLRSAPTGISEYSFVTTIDEDARFAAPYEMSNSEISTTESRHPCDDGRK